MGGMVGIHVGEDRCEQGIGLHVLGEARGQTVQGVEAAAPRMGEAAMGSGIAPAHTLLFKGSTLPFAKRRIQCA
jgi:hypothetical protein